MLLKVHNAGVCHSDVHIHDGYFDLGGGNKLPMANIQLPHTLGHEIEGEVVAVGPDVKDIKVGARYAAFPWIGCGKCASCLRGEENICVGGPRQLGCNNGCPGGYATHVMIPHPKYLIDYGKTDPALGAAYMCSGVTAYAAMKKIGKLGPKDQVLVLGCGGVGMMGVQFAQRAVRQGAARRRHRREPSRSRQEGRRIGDLQHAKRRRGQAADGRNRRRRLCGRRFRRLGEDASPSRASRCAAAAR